MQVKIFMKKTFTNLEYLSSIILLILFTYSFLTYNYFLSSVQQASRWWAPCLYMTGDIYVEYIGFIGMDWNNLIPFLLPRNICRYSSFLNLYQTFFCVIDFIFNVNFITFHCYFIFLFFFFFLFLISFYYFIVKYY